jgi:hypothetical protein
MDDQTAGVIQGDVLFGKEGWLFFYKGNHRCFDFLTGVRKPTPKSVHNFASNIEKRAAFCQNRGIHYLHIVFPDKPVIMTEYLPPPL